MENKLRELGLSEKESAVYKAIAEFGKSAPSRIAKATGIKRPTVYAVAAELIQKGLVEADDSRATTFYMPASRFALKRVIEREKEELRLRELLLEGIAKDVEEMPRSKTYAVPKLQFVEHEENVDQFLHRQTKVWNDSIMRADKIWWGFQDHSYVENYREVIRYYWKNTPPSISLKLLTNDSDVEKEMVREKFERRQIKFWKRSVNFTATQWIVGDYAVFLMTRQKPHYLVQMHDPVYCENMRELFRSLWEEVT